MSNWKLARALLALSAAACAHRSNVRETAAVRIGDTREQWRLEWRSPTKEVCRPETDEAATCPCSGFAYGEMGVLDLVRRRAGAVDERLPLAPFFGLGESPGDSGLAVVARWPLDPSDIENRDSVERAADARSRDSVHVMTFGDYDHDGRATEFPLQIGTTPCGKRETIVIGVSRDAPSLHAFTSVAHPERPLVLQSHTWEALLHSNGSVSMTELSCGDHGSDTRIEVNLTATPRGIDGTRLTYDCPEPGRPPKLISTDRL